MSARRILAREQETEVAEGLREVVEALREVVWLSDPEMTEVLYVSPAYERVFGRSRESLYRDPSSWLEAVHPEDRERVRQAAAASAVVETEATYRIRRADGALRWVRARGFPVPSVAGESTRCAGLAEDVTDRLQAEERLAALSRRLVQVQEEERRTIARELHDEAGQILTGLKLMLEASERSGAGVDLAQMKDLAGQLVERVRDLTLDLRPPMLDDLGLVPTLLWHFERYRVQTGIEVRFHHRGISGRLPAESEIAAFRIAQEALTNVARHAGVAQAAVELWRAGDTLHLQVADDGRGFDPSGVAEASGGLAGMRERALLLGGSLTLDSHRGTGTRLAAELPATAPGRPAERR